MDESFFSKAKIPLYALIGILLINTLINNYFLFVHKVHISDTQDVTENTSPIVEAFIISPTPTSTAKPKIIDSCSPYKCPDLIRLATASLALKTTSSDSPSPGTREFYIPFGGGQATSDQYEDVPGLSAYIDSTKYGKIVSATFEASMRIPTANGKVYAQLFNVTDNHAVWTSEVSMEGPVSKLVISGPITLAAGNRLYKVQMKSTLKYAAILDQARVHIIAE